MAGGVLLYHAAMDDWPGIRQIAAVNLDGWRRSGVVKTLKFYSADDAVACAVCECHHQEIVAVEDGVVGVNLPPLDDCKKARCRCYFRPWDVSVE